MLTGAAKGQAATSVAIFDAFTWLAGARRAWLRARGNSPRGGGRDYLDTC